LRQRLQWQLPIIVGGSNSSKDIAPQQQLPLIIALSLQSFAIANGQACDDSYPGHADGVMSASCRRSTIRRADRLFEIVQCLRRTRHPVSAEAIAEELEVSKRTIYRDIAVLIGQRIPITGEPGVGYILERGFDMPPLMLTPDELDAAILGANWVASRGEPELARAARDLIAKIEAVVPAALHSHILEPATSIAPVPVPPERIRASMLREAVRGGRKVSLVYEDSSGTRTNRIVWPVLLGYRDSGRIMTAWCETRNAFRYFRTDRIIAAEILDARIPERRATLRLRWQTAMDDERERYRTNSAE
jgi:predicted DNA-binding transcriptional regulator YafY